MKRLSSFVYISSLPHPSLRSINQSIISTEEGGNCGPLSLPLLCSALLLPIVVSYVLPLFLSFFLFCFFFALPSLPPPLSSSLLPHLPTLFFIFPHGFLPCSHWKKLSSLTTLLKNNHWGGGMRVGTKSTRERRDQTNHLSPRTGPKESVRESLKKKKEKKRWRRGVAVSCLLAHIFTMFSWVVCC